MRSCARWRGRRERRSCSATCRARRRSPLRGTPSDRRVLACPTTPSGAWRRYRHAPLPPKVHVAAARARFKTVACSGVQVSVCGSACGSGLRVMSVCGPLPTGPRAAGHLARLRVRDGDDRRRRGSGRCRARGRRAATARRRRGDALARCSSGVALCRWAKHRLVIAAHPAGSGSQHASECICKGPLDDVCMVGMVACMLHM